MGASLPTVNSVCGEWSVEQGWTAHNGTYGRLWRGARMGILIACGRVGRVRRFPVTCRLRR